MNKSPLRSSFLSFNYFIKTRAIFPFLLPVFFVLHGFIANYSAVYVADALLLIFFYMVITVIIAGIGWLFYRDITKASLFAFLVMAYHFFFGFIQDALTDLAPHSIVSQYRFILPVSCLCIVVVIAWLKKRKKTLFTITYYLNILLLLLIGIDTVGFVKKSSGAGKSYPFNANNSFTICDSCKRPDVYFILLDQYAGNTALKEVFDFDNAAFETDLTRRGFHIAKNSSSNYNLTPFSMASTLDMNYLGPEMDRINHLNVTYSYNVIRNSQVINFISAYGYKFYNLSVFDFPGQPAYKYRSFFPYGTDLITSQTFISRLKKAVRADILSGKLRMKTIQKKILYEQLYFNDGIFEQTRNVAAQHANMPKFVYSHFILPHWPYYFDSKGRPVPIEKLQGFHETSAHDYIEYLQYGNGKILQLVDYIFSVSPTPPVIILLSDHGFRNPEKKASHKYDFFNLNAVYLPDKNYSQFPDNMTNVNFFRIFFNTSFNQHFSLLKDSTINLW